MAPTSRVLYGDENTLVKFVLEEGFYGLRHSEQAPAEVWKMTGNKTKGRSLKFVEFSCAIHNFIILEFIGRKAQLAS